MRVAYLDCFAGIAGDMFLGALLGAGVPESVLHEATAALDIDASLQIELVDRSGISSIKVHVMEGDHLAEQDPRQMQDPLAQQHADTQHSHKHSHAHNHGNEHQHTHGRSLTAICTLIQNAPLHDAVKATAILTFQLLGESEARIHNVPVKEIHFHEVGAVDAIVDIVATCAGIHHLGVDAWYSSPLNVGGGMVKCTHGTFPVPAPATADLLRGMPTYSAHLQKELVTPTGAALLRALAPAFGQQPPMRVDTIGYGAGTRNPPGFPNLLRLSVGELSIPNPKTPKQADTREAAHNINTETVVALETALDDASPQILAFAAEQALVHGALDVMLTPVIMKKGRPGTLLTVLSSPEHSDKLAQLILRETPTLGVRLRRDERVCLHREHLTVSTEYGSIRIKLGLDGDTPRNAAPEFEDCKAAALQHGVPLKLVQQAAIAAFLNHSAHS